ncbi:NYN domain-containing protein [Citreicella sp. C3M06]|uniref:NYN domain-containing protein n=1 Tax=Citreicella sp. C3M06 TaxID=2841564 RepID=UPI001C0A3AD3|nr:NYN domain-containing protein [Citreicella sp. C3M06]MBU2963003.1 NYN domain-containing protein [Citreicella sp. C3M06]
MNTLPSRAAALVDGDNISPKHAARILRAARSIGQLDVARVYGVMAGGSDWLKAPGWRFVHAGGGKNATDLLMSIDAMELALALGIETFVLATSDSDFTHVAQRLRERGAKVVGVGERKAPEQFRAACSDFFELPTEAQPAIDASAKPVPPTRRPSQLDEAIKLLIAKHSEQGKGMLLSEFGGRIHHLQGTVLKDLPEGSWRGYFEARPSLFGIDPKGTGARVRFLRSGFASA